MLEKRGHKISMLANITSKGSLGNYITRYLVETDVSKEIPSWNVLKESLYNMQKNDPNHVLAVMRGTRQNSNETL